METNMYDYDSVASNEYDKRVPWIPQQNQSYATRDAGVPTQYTQYTQRIQQQPSRLQEQRPQQKAGTQAQKPKPMPKAKTLALVHTFKQWLVVASLVGFGTLSGLAAFHQVSSTSTTSASKTATSSSTTKSTTSSSSTFLNQSGGSNSGTSSTSGTGSSSSGTSGTSSSSSSSAPVSGSQTS